MSTIENHATIFSGKDSRNRKKESLGNLCNIFPKISLQFTANKGKEYVAKAMGYEFFIFPKKT